MEHWEIRKPAVEAAGGMVVSQHSAAAEVGAEVLAKGGNAVDAAVAAGFALATVEPWMSGLGGCGFMTLHRADTQKAYAIDFGVRSAASLDLGEYPLSQGFDSDLFAWPGVKDNRNVLGPFSVAVPSYVAGVSLALEKFGTFQWKELLAPAIEIADKGLVADWYSSLKIASSAADLARFESTRDIYLPNGFVPMGQWAAAPPTIKISGLAETIEQLAHEGPSSFYQGALSKKLLDDFKRVDIGLSAEDLATYKAKLTEVSGFSYRDAKVYAPPGLCAGPTLEDALSRLQSLSPSSSLRPDGAHYRAMGESLDKAYADRLMRMGHSPDGKVSASTTHLNVIDRHGNAVSLTQTLLSIFGSKLTLPDTGILMNNGMMWFDPQPGRPNSLMPSQQPLSNMCPAIVVLPSGSLAAVGASGGRRIVSSVMQLIAFMVDFGMDPETAMHTPRIDVSGSGQLLADLSLDQTILDHLNKDFPEFSTAQHEVFPSMFSCPSIATFDPQTNRTTGAAFVTSPSAAAVPEKGC